MSGLSEPPRTPVSSTASSFLSFSPETPSTPSPSIHGPDTTPRGFQRSMPSPILASETGAHSQASSSSLSRTETSPGPSPACDVFGDEYCISPVQTVFSSRNPFAAILAAQPSPPSSAFSDSPTSPSYPAPTSHLSTSSGGSSSSASTPTQASGEDDLVVCEGAFINQVDSLVLHGPGRAREDDNVSVMLEAFGIVGDGDASSAWEDELYSTFSNEAPSSPSSRSRPRYPSSPIKTPRDGSSSPRKSRKVPFSPRHAFRHTSSRTASPLVSPRRAFPGSPTKSRPLSRTPSSPGKRSRSVTCYSLTSSPALGSAFTLDNGFQLHPTSPIYRSPQQQQTRRLPVTDLALAPSPVIHLSPPRASRKSPTSTTSNGHRTPHSLSSSSKSKTRAIAALEDKLLARAERRKQRRQREEPLNGRPIATSAEGFDVEALDRFFGVTPRHAKAVQGGYGEVAMREGMVGGEDGEEVERWRKVEEFRSLLHEKDEEGGEDDLSSAAEEASEEDMTSTSGTEAARRRPNHRPPPLTLAHPADSRSASNASSTSSLASQQLAEPLDLTCPRLATPSPSASSLSGSDPLRYEVQRRQDDALHRSKTATRDAQKKSLKNKKSMGNRLKDMFIGGR
ncbi:hypothetical protein JCM11641_003889 [Rhodosporidiobolus odoratus]